MRKAKIEEKEKDFYRGPSRAKVLPTYNTKLSERDWVRYRMIWSAEEEKDRESYDMVGEYVS